MWQWLNRRLTRAPTPHSGPGDLAELGELIREIRFALLTTVDRDYRLHSRPVQTLQVEDNRTLWFFTDWSSPKVDELHHDVRVSLGYADPKKHVYVAVSGSGSLIRDIQKAKQLWRIEQLPDGAWRIMSKSKPLALSAVGASSATLSKFDSKSDKQRWLVKTP